MGWVLEWTADGQRRATPLVGRLTIGRRPGCDVVIEDPYASRVHCEVTVRDNQVHVDATASLNQVLFRGRLVPSAALKHGQAFVIGDTAFTVRRVDTVADDRTLPRENAQPAGVSLRLSTREVIGSGGAVITRLSESEFRVLSILAQRFPDAASHDELAAAVWEGRGYDRYLLHRLVQRIRQRLGSTTGLIDSVRGAGYRVTAPVRLI